MRNFTFNLRNIGLAFLLPLVSGGVRAAENPALTIAVKFVEYTDGAGKPVLSREQANAVVAGVNKIYSQCNMKMSLQDYQTVRPGDFGLVFGTHSMNDMERIRQPFDTPKELVVTHTGPWDHAAMGVANAWTAMPGENPSGAVIEGPVAANVPIVAHELGHYLNLEHVSDASDLMDPVVYLNSTKITPAQCQTMRQTAQTVRSESLRS